MRMIRSFFFGGLAMIAAVMFLSVPARAIDYEPGLSAYSLDWPDAAFSYVHAVDAVPAAHEGVPKPAANSHAIIYASQNRPLTSWRFACDAYSHIDPHIAIG